MMTGYNNKQTTVSLYLAIVCITACNAIIVDWNTNKGPIVPPTTTQRPIPQKPYREPAPVWEDQSNDIPNSNPYVYVLPPPSRPKYNDIDSGYQKPQAPNTNKIISHPSDNKGNPSVPSLTVQYVPNVGNKYVAIVASPSPSTATNYNNNNNFVTNSHSIAQSQQQTNYNTNSDINNNYSNNNNKWDYMKSNKVDKLNGKYSDKLKKYKSYEKFLPYYRYVEVPVKQTYYYQQQPQYQQQQEQQQPQTHQQTLHYYQQQPQTFPQQITTSYKSNISKS